MSFLRGPDPNDGSTAINWYRETGRMQTALEHMLPTANAPNVGTEHKIYEGMHAVVNVVIRAYLDVLEPTTSIAGRELFHALRIITGTMVMVTAKLTLHCKLSEARLGEILVPKQGLCKVGVRRFLARPRNFFFEKHCVVTRSLDRSNVKI